MGVMARREILCGSPSAEETPAFPRRPRAGTHNPELIGQADGRDASAAGGGFQFGVFGETGAGLFRFGQVKIARAHRLDAMRPQERLDFAHLALIVTGDDQTTAARQFHASARFCNSINSPMPLRASPSSCANWSSVKGAPSAVPCTSTKPPLPVSTKLASVSAVESSL